MMIIDFLALKTRVSSGCIDIGKGQGGKYHVNSSDIIKFSMLKSSYVPRPIKLLLIIWKKE